MPVPIRGQIRVASCVSKSLFILAMFSQPIHVICIASLSIKQDATAIFSILSKEFVFDIHLKSPINPFKQSKSSAIFEKKNSIPFLFLTMVTSEKPRLNHRLVYKEHNPSASQSFISTVILEKKRNDLIQFFCNFLWSLVHVHVAFSGCLLFWFYVWHILFQKYIPSIAMTSFETFRMF